MGVLQKLFAGRAKSVNVAKEIGILRRSPLLDPRWYRQTYPDLWCAPIDVVRHYIEHGAREGRNPHPYFDTQFYLANNPDVAVSGINPLVHYIERGAREGRNPHPGFDTQFYLTDNPDVAESGINPLVHYTLHGSREGRNTRPGSGDRPQDKKGLFDPKLVTDIDLITGSDLFDARYYLNSNPDVKGANLDPAHHYMSHGWKEGRQPSAVFNASKYLRDNSDVRDGGGNPLVHWLRWGRSENRPFPSADKSDSNKLSYYCDINAIETVYIRHYDADFHISVITPTYNTDQKYLSELLFCLKNQRYSNWEWIIVDDGSVNPDTIGKLKIIARSDPRIQVVFRKRSGIAAASNTALSFSTGSHIALVDHDDLLARDAFLLVWEQWKKEPKAELFYTDECKISDSYQLYDFFHKPEWSPLYLENTMYIGHLSVYKADVLQRVGGFRSAFDGTQDYDLALRASTMVTKVRHIPSVCYFWRAIEGSTAATLSAKTYVLERQKAAVLEHVQKRNPAAEVRAGWSPGFWSVDYPLGAEPPLVSYVIPTAARSRMVRGAKVDLLEHCITSLEVAAFYPRREFVVVHNGDLTQQQRNFLATIEDAVLVEYRPKGYYNFSEKINLGVKSASGEYVCLLNDDVEVVTPGGGARMVGFLESNPEVGALAPLCLFEDGRVQHNGIVLTARGPTHSGIFKEAQFPGHFGYLRCRREAFGVTGALLFIKKSHYQAVGGFDEAFPINYNDVDFCLKLRARGLACVVDPNIVVYHFESSSKAGTFPCEKELFYLKWGSVRDPFFNENLSQYNPYYEVADAKDDDVRRMDNDSSAFEQWLDREIYSRRKKYGVNRGAKLTVGVSVYDQTPLLLNEMLASYLMQTYENKEFIVIDNGSTSPETIDWIRQLENTGTATIVRHKRNIGINGANRSILKAMTGEFLLPVDADDYWTVDALTVMASYIEKHRGTRIFYSDEFNSDINSRQFNPFFKPDFDPVLLMNCCYPAHLMAIERNLLIEIDAYSDDRATWCHDYDTLARALARGIKAVHVPELLYAWRMHPGSTAAAGWEAKPQSTESQRFVLDRLLTQLGKEDLLAIERNDLFSHPGMWRLRLKGSIPAVHVIAAPRPLIGGFDKLYGELLASAQTVDGPEWIAILTEASDREGVLSRLFEVALFDSDVVVVSGIVINNNGQTVYWSGGMFTSENTVMDLYFGRPFSESGYHGQLYCQRCVDVAAPVNVLLRKEFVRRTMAKFGTADYMSFLVALGIEAALLHKYVAVTPHVRHVMSESEVCPLPDDRGDLLGKMSGFGVIGRWYNPSLPSLASEAYQIIERRDAEPSDRGDDLTGDGARVG
jgi:GT2 family glycosyltransferase